ncbi:MAG: DUF1634 domain-containing protein [Chloroflexi bacterium]|nr:DUF1634 domain-containing protein [Chloroflexota bacterium]
MSRARAPRRVTRGVLHVGTLVGGACLLLALVLEVVGGPGVVEASAGTGSSLLDVPAIAASVVGLHPWGWSALGVWVVIATPGIALVATALEFRAIGDRWAVGATLATIALLVLSLGVGLVRGS